MVPLLGSLEATGDLFEPFRLVDAGGVPIREDPQIAEVQYGRWEGMTYEDLIVDEEYLRYREEPILSSTPGGECIGEVQARGVEAVMSTLAENDDGRCVLFVSHGDIIRTVLCHFLAMELRHFRRIRVDNAALSAVQVAGEFAVELCQQRPLRGDAQFASAVASAESCGGVPPLTMKLAPGSAGNTAVSDGPWPPQHVRFRDKGGRPRTVL